MDMVIHKSIPQKNLLWNTKNVQFFKYLENAWTDVSESFERRYSKKNSTTWRKKILKKIINEGCGREQKFEFCFDSSVRIFCSICLKTAQVNLHTKKTLSLQFCPGFEK